MIKWRIMRWAGHVACMGGRAEFYTGFWWCNMWKHHLENPGVYGRKDTKKDLQEVGCRGMDWIDLVQDMDRWHAIVNVIMNFLVP
jgi:hypothetical protein